ncbi:DUF1697 domain-containing protein [Paenibacillus rigui]|uniref:Cytoplasmic protein n=1 Tax=Paenibacillus rigui TaxID=554312 RepID=A0A229UQB4_9BACL|nr:DUF1697 domain-containing protein [Paenibacillus rigui]OXM85618.1 cytoplasmic protein [Paenibacillus rigui]
MTVYIGLLRGINVGGNNKIKMAELKQTLEAIGLGRVQTYLQSGNVVFVSEELPDVLRGRIEEEIKRGFGISLTVVLRTAEEWEQLLAACPYDSEALKPGESIQISVLIEQPPQEIGGILENGSGSTDEFQIRGREIYYLFRQSVLDSKLASNIQKLGDKITTRNWNTMSKLGALAQALHVE